MTDEDMQVLAVDQVPDEPVSRQLSPALLERVFHQPALIYFNAVARHLSVREASRRLNTAPSAVTRQIAHLEAVLDLALFVREGGRLKLAPAGEILYRHTRALVTPLVSAIAELDMLRGLKVGTVRIASAESVGLTFVPEIMSEFGMRYPRLHLTANITSSAEVTERVASGMVDVGFTFITRTTPEVEVSCWRDVPIGVLMRPDHALSREPGVTLASCVTRPFAVATRHISIRDVIEPFLHRALLSHQPFVEVDSIRMLVALACTGRYVSIMTPIGAEQELADARLLFRAFQDKRLPRNRFGIITRRNGNLSHAAAMFFEHARRRLASARFPS